MQTVGLTGGIGAGKSTIARILQQLGYPVYIADKEATRLMNTDTHIVRELKKKFGDGLYGLSGILDKKKLAGLIFNDKTALLEVKAIVHPRVMEDFRQWAQRQRSPLVFFESAILFEAGLDAHFQHTICVTAPLSLRLHRVIRRDQTSAGKVEERMKNQMDDGRKCRKASFVIYNDENHKTLEQTLSLVNQLETNTI